MVGRQAETIGTGGLLVDYWWFNSSLMAELFNGGLMAVYGGLLAVY